MGCISSKARINNPEKNTEAYIVTNKIYEHKGMFEEEEKGKDKMTVSSQQTEIPLMNSSRKSRNVRDKGNKKTKELEAELRIEEMYRNAPTLNSAYKEDAITLREREIEREIMRRIEEEENQMMMYNEIVKAEESIFKITRKQHEEILKFVDDRVRCIQAQIIQIYDNLLKNDREHEELQFLIQELRHNGKDIENCMEDLLSYPFNGDGEYLYLLHRKLRLVKKVTLEYNKHQKDPQNYSEFKDIVISILLQYDPALPTTKQSMWNFKENKMPLSELDKSSMFVPKEETPMRRMDTENEDPNMDLDFRLKMSLNNSRDEGYGNMNNIEKREVLKLIQETKPLTEKLTEQDIITKYYELFEEVEVLNEGLKNLRESWNIVQTEIQEFKKNRGTSSEAYVRDQLQQIKSMEENLYKESETFWGQCMDLQIKIKKFKNKLNGNGTKQKEFIDPEYEQKLNELEYQVARKLKEMEQLVLTFSVVFREIYEPKQNVVNKELDISHLVKAKKSDFLDRSGYSNQSPERIIVSPFPIIDRKEDEMTPRRKLFVDDEGEKKDLPRTLTNMSVKNLSAVLKGDVNEVTIDDLEIKNLSPEILEKKKNMDHNGKSYAYSQSTATNSREDQNVLQHIYGHNDTYFSQNNRLY